MAVLQDDLAIAVRDILRGSDFDPYLPQDRVDVGLTWEGMGDLGAYGRALVVPLEARMLEGKSLQGSRQVEFRFLIIYEVSDLADPFAKITGFQDRVRKHFGDGGRMLETTLVDSTSSWLGKSLRVEMDAPSVRMGGQPLTASPNPDVVELRIPLSIRAWQLI